MIFGKMKVKKEHNKDKLMKKIIPYIIFSFLIISNVYGNGPLKPQVLTNHLGYEPGGSKKAVVLI